MQNKKPQQSWGWGSFKFSLLVVNWWWWSFQTVGRREGAALLSSRWRITDSCIRGHPDPRIKTSTAVVWMSTWGFTQYNSCYLRWWKNIPLKFLMALMVYHYSILYCVVGVKREPVSFSPSHFILGQLVIWSFIWQKKTSVWIFTMSWQTGTPWISHPGHTGILREAY